MIVFLVGSKKKARIVIKIGTNLLFNDKKIIEDNFNKIASSIAGIKNHEIIIVSSGAVAIGSEELKISAKHEDDIIRNICSSVGQNELMMNFRKNFLDENIKVGQLLLTHNDISNRETFLQVRNVIDKMIKHRIIPIINENDTIKSMHNKFRDNDQLAIRIASKIEADLLIILTNVGGVYTQDPRVSSDAELLKELRKDDIKKIKIGKKNGQNSLGGMQSKIDSALLCSQLGIPTVIANGNDEDIIRKVIDGFEHGTKFKADDRIKSKKRWILLTKEKGEINIDEGALNALKNDKSLLAVGINSVKGEFLVNDVVAIKSDNKIIGKAIVDCSSDILLFIKGKKTEDINKIIKDYASVAKHENISLIKG
ncbi:MAG: glutamate 5-kinase [Candidatus Woesearchaeota archaeon]